MKTKLIKIFAIVVILACAGQLAINKAFANQSRAVSGFTSIASSGPFRIYVKIDGTESVKINADASIADQIETVVEGGTLKIRYKHQFGWSDRDDNHKANIYVSARSLSAVINSGPGSINVNGAISTPKFKAVLSGSGSIVMGAVKADKIDGVISGSGSITLSGSAPNASIAISGSGSFDAKALRTESAKISISGSGNVYINAERELSASLIGSGSVRYTGNASVHTSKLGSGSVSKASY